MKQQLMTVLVLVLVLGGMPPGVALGAETAPDGFRLSLAECLSTALQNNLDLMSVRKDPMISEQVVEGNAAEFDPALSVTTSSDQTKQTPADPTQASDRRNTSIAPGITQQLPVGGSYTASFFMNRNDAGEFNTVGFDLTGQRVVINPRLDAGIDLRFNMPLLRGRGRNTRQEQLLLSRSDLEMSREELSRRAQLTIETTEGAYWDVLAAQEALRVANESLRRAQDLLELNRKKVEVGTLAPIEITQAEAGVAAEEENVIIAETTLANAEDELRRLMAIPPDDPRWDRPLLIADRPSFDPVTVDVAAAIETALENRPELFNANEELRKRELSERAARNRVKHGLDLALRFQPTGNNDGSYPDPNAPPPPLPGSGAIVGVKDGAADAVSEIFNIDNYFWSASMTYSLPLGNHAAKADLRVAELNTQKGEIDLRNEKQTIRVEVRAAAREVESGTKRIEAATKNVELQEKKLDAEQKKFENGMSTSFEVLTFQRDLADAQLAQINAALNYVKALTALERSQGTLLQARGLDLAE